MRIAEIAPVWVPVPPPGYGGIELVVSLLANGLVERGHEVTLYAAIGSESSARIISPVPEGADLAEMGTDVGTEVAHALPAYLAIDEFDVIHDHSGVGTALGAARNGKPPVVHTLHGPWTESSRRFYAAVSPPIRLIAISEAQKAENPDLAYAGVVHNGIDLDIYPWQKEKEDFLVWLGRCSPEKGPGRAVEIAKEAGKRLVLMMKRSEPAEMEYWEKEVKPRLRGDEEVLFNVGHDEKVDVLSRARATLFPIQWPEPFGLVMIESMACGTPVLATALGAAPEIIVDGSTGILVADTDDMVEALSRLDDLSPEACRERVADHFSADAMVTKTERVLEEAVAGD
ncbi:MAG: glycosyltransferase family 4 protein [Acidimicrobiales bacterium]|nr:glycosyltransferase family 4 protein [Actinomycetota bacterium]